MPISKPKRQLSTNSAGLRQATSLPYSRPTNTNDDNNAYHANYLPLPSTRFPPGTPLTAKRSRKMYSDLADESEFLLKLREQWVKKLNDLKEDHKYLSKMKNITKEEAVGIQPLFAREEEESLELQHPPQTPLATDQQSEIGDQQEFEMEDDQVEIREPETLNALEELEAIFKNNKGSDEEDNEEEEDEDEDEEKARMALNLMLQQFGDSI